jgi:hypothetical protein
MHSLFSAILLSQWKYACPFYNLQNYFTLKVLLYTCVKADVMKVLLDFVYTETVNVSVENVQELLPAACLLQLTGKLLV